MRGRWILRSLNWSIDSISKPAGGFCSQDSHKAALLLGSFSAELPTAPHTFFPFPRANFQHGSQCPCQSSASQWRARAWSLPPSSRATLAPSECFASRSFALEISWGRSVFSGFLGSKEAEAGIGLLSSCKRLSGYGVCNEIVIFSYLFWYTASSKYTKEKTFCALKAAVWLVLCVWARTNTLKNICNLKPSLHSREVKCLSQNSSGIQILKAFCLFFHKFW